MGWACSTNYNQSTDYCFNHDACVIRQATETPSQRQNLD